MSYREPFTENGISTLEICFPKAVVDHVKNCLKEGNHKIELEHSSFTDPSDYTSIIIDGRTYYRQDGY